MRQLLAIARLTFFEGVRMRVVVVILVLLAFVILRLPFALRGDETLAGRLQNFLSYALQALSVFLSVATVFFSCATLTKEVQTRTLHLVVTKPVSRFKILFGKWIGVNLLNLLLVIVAGSVVYGFAWFIKTRPVDFMRDRVALDDTVWTARMANEPVVPDMHELAEAQVEQRMNQRGAAGALLAEGEKEEAIAQRLRELEESFWHVPPGIRAVYRFEDLPPQPEGAAVQVRFKLRGIPTPALEKLDIRWLLVDPENGGVLSVFDTEERAYEAHQFLFKEGAVKDGRIEIHVINLPQNAPSVAWFEGDHAFQILYKVGSFETNYVKALTLLFGRLAFLSALGLFFGTFVSFPVAAFCVMVMFVFCLANGVILEAIGANMTLVSASMDPYGGFGPLIRPFVVPLLRYVLPNFMVYDGIDQLIDGTYIADGLLLQAMTHTLVFGVILLVIPGWLIFRSREVAAVTV